jgi:hypothetical protein
MLCPNEIEAPGLKPGRYRVKIDKVKNNSTADKKTGGALCSAPPEIFQSKWLQRLDVRRLQALGAADDFEFNRLAIVQRLIAISHNRGEMDENVLTALALDESKALAGVKPLHCSLFFAHCCVSFQDLSYLVLRYAFYEFQRRYKSNKRNKTVPRLAIYSKVNRKLLIVLRFTGEYQVRLRWASGQVVGAKGAGTYRGATVAEKRRAGDRRSRAIFRGGPGRCGGRGGLARQRLRLRGWQGRRYRRGARELEG